MQSITKSNYTPNFSFQDPIVKYEGINSFIFNINALRTAIKITYKLQHVQVNGPSELRPRRGVLCFSSLELSPAGG